MAEFSVYAHRKIECVPATPAWVYFLNGTGTSNADENY